MKQGSWCFVLVAKQYPRLVNIAIPRRGDANFARAGHYGHFPINEIDEQIRQQLCLNRFDLSLPALRLSLIVDLKFSRSYLDILIIP